MPILTPTKLNGAKVKAAPGLYAELPQQLSDQAISAPMVDTGLNPVFTADLLSAMLAHERCGRHLYRTCEERSNNPMLQAKYREFGQETERHVEILEELVVAAGGDPGYVSPMARAVEGMDTKLVESTFMLSGTLDPMTAEMSMLDAVFLAESVCQANWLTLDRLANEMDEGPVLDRLRAATAEVLSQEDEHLGWSQSTRERLVVLQAKSTVMAKAGAKLEETVAHIRNWFNNDDTTNDPTTKEAQT